MIDWLLLFAVLPTAVQAEESSAKSFQYTAWITYVSS